MFGAYFDEGSRDPERQAHRFDRIADRYDLVNDVASLGCSRRWTRAFARAVVESVDAGPADAERADADATSVDRAEGRPGDSPVSNSPALNRLPLRGLHILDVACGTGTSSRALARLGADVIGCDVSEGMVAEARRRETGRDVVTARADGRCGAVTYCIADACDMGFADNRFDAVTCCYGLRNMPSPVAALEQMRRVARPGAPIVTLDFDMPSGTLLSNAYRLYDAIVLPLVGGLLTGHPSDYRYLTQTIEQWPGRRGVAHMMRVVGLRHPQCRPLTKGIASLNRAWK
ncbi:ubiquinone/menaquinone biosynthesis methyltransferase [Pseudoscardovia radai]|uniref:Ubiquinone/menaquinone biosynthesis methyltransferase n=1 Tax=Pseudoscardovia radai TaxID=987066 RepID=A0A261F2E9_9BIFI|nr:class I SAM-dependent methyltransferase [Pseudoscardovia radai]OZG53297.1 ubiquinone/menaquinone biosynthesis methyltransferase [Pseudoscardovia radai]